MVDCPECNAMTSISESCWYCGASKELLRDCEPVNGCWADEEGSGDIEEAALPL